MQKRDDPVCAKELGSDSAPGCSQLDFRWLWPFLVMIEAKDAAGVSMCVCGCRYCCFDVFDFMSSS